jgi:hypothetical protein
LAVYAILIQQRHDVLEVLEERKTSPADIEKETMIKYWEYWKDRGHNSPSS